MATWYRIRSYRGVFDWQLAVGHILLQTEEGARHETTALKADEFRALLDVLRNESPVFTDGRSKIATGEELAGKGDTAIRQAVQLNANEE